MRARTAGVVLVALLVGAAGCTAPAGPAKQPTSAAQTTAPGTPIPTAEATERALTAEQNRVERVLRNASGVTGSSVGVYGEPNATVVAQNGTGLTVRVTMSYSYGYDCADRNGAVDALTTTARYRVTPESTALRNVSESVAVICEDLENTTSDDPPKGANLLSVTPVSNETVANASDNATANVSALGPDQREVFFEAYECDCNVEQSVFRFNDDDRIEYVRYEGRWYFLRVAIV